MHCDKFIINSISFKEVLADIWHTTAKKPVSNFPEIARSRTLWPGAMTQAAAQVFIRQV